LSVWLKYLLRVLTLEKIVQHSLSAVFFLFDVPGIGKPDVGSVFHLSYSVMAALNILMSVGFMFGFVGVVEMAGRGVWLVGGLAVLDVLLELVFHGFGYLTVSVVVSLVLIGIILLQRNMVNQFA
jgi:hypothetical protein